VITAEFLGKHSNRWRGNVESVVAGNGEAGETAKHGRLGESAEATENFFRRHGGAGSRPRARG
jgi:hypothetical protein